MTVVSSRYLLGTLTTNIFNRLGNSFGCEDFFTATVGLFIERNAQFRDALLKWLEPAAGESLLYYAYQVEIQSASPSCAGAAVLDMKLRHPEIELWFEHKIGAPLGKRKSAAAREFDQLEKYLDAAARAMCGVGAGGTEVEWPAGSPVPGQPRVLLFCISRGGTPLQREVYSNRLHQPGRHGLVWPAAGPLRWRDFWPQAQFALEPVLQGEQVEFERTLTCQFLSYWQSLPGMWQSTDTGATWREVHTKDEQGRFPSLPLWDGILQLAREKLGWRKSGGYLVEHYLAVPAGQVEQVMVSALTGRDQMPVDSQGMPDEVTTVIERPSNEAEGILVTNFDVAIALHPPGYGGESLLDSSLFRGRYDRTRRLDFLHEPQILVERFNDDGQFVNDSSFDSDSGAVLESCRRGS